MNMLKKPKEDNLVNPVVSDIEKSENGLKISYANASPKELEVGDDNGIVEIKDTVDEQTEYETHTISETQNDGTENQVSKFTIPTEFYTEVEPYVDYTGRTTVIGQRGYKVVNGVKSVNKQMLPDRSIGTDGDGHSFKAFIIEDAGNANYNGIRILNTPYGSSTIYPIMSSPSREVRIRRLRKSTGSDDKNINRGLCIDGTQCYLLPSPKFVSEISDSDGVITIKYFDDSENTEKTQTYKYCTIDYWDSSTNQWVAGKSMNIAGGQSLNINDVTQGHLLAPDGNDYIRKVDWDSENENLQFYGRDNTVTFKLHIPGASVVS